MERVGAVVSTPKETVWVAMFPAASWAKRLTTCPLSGGGERAWGAPPPPGGTGGSESTESGRAAIGAPVVEGAAVHVTSTAAEFTYVFAAGEVISRLGATVS